MMRLKVSIEQSQKPKAQVKRAKRLKKDVGSTLKWMHVQGVSNHAMHLKKGKKEEIVMGYKIEPHAIHLDTEAVQAQWIRRIRSFYNHNKKTLYDAYVFTPLNLDDHIAYLMNRIDTESDPMIVKMIMDDIEKSNAFIDNWLELSFYIMIKGKDTKQFQKDLTELRYGLIDAGFNVNLMNRIDFENYIANVFENTMIQDFIFGHGVFACLEEERQALKEVNIDEFI